MKNQCIIDYRLVSGLPVAPVYFIESDVIHNDLGGLNQTVLTHLSSQIKTEYL